MLCCVYICDLFIQHADISCCFQPAAGDSEEIQKISKLEAAIVKEEKKLSEITSDLDGIHRVRLNKAFSSFKALHLYPLFKVNLTLESLTSAVFRV